MAKPKKSNGGKVENQIVNLRDRVKLVATEKAPYHKPDAEFYAHPLTAKRFVDAGIAIYAD